jgi:type IV pilus assembly protein PilW
MNRVRARCPSVRARGFTLVELMVAMTLALLVLSGLATLFAGTSRNRIALERSSRMHQNAGYALEVLADEVRQAGYYAELNLAGVGWQVPDPCATAADSLGYSVAPFNIPVAVTGYRGTDVPPDCIKVTGKWRAGTDVIVLRRLGVQPTPVDEAEGAPFLQVSKCSADPATWAYSTVKTAFTLRKLDCATPADVRQVTVRAYFVSDCDECGVDTIPTLKRAELVGNQIVITPLAEGVENLQVDYGFDTDNDGNADVWLPWLSGNAGAADNDWANVVALRPHLVARSTDTESGYSNASRQVDLGSAGLITLANDGRKRVALAATVRVNNVAMRRETP